MKALFKLITLAGFFGLGMTACQKEFTIEDRAEPPQAGTDSNYIDRYYYFEQTPGGLDTLWGYYFQYDSLKRVVAVYYNEDFPTTTYTLEYKYYYNNTDTIPNKIEEFDGLTDLNPSVTYFNFDSQQRITSDSMRHFNNSGVLDILQVINYSYGSGKMYAHTRRTEHFPPGMPQHFIERDTAVLNLFGDILNHQKYEEIAGVSILRGTSEFTYGNQAGPFATSSVLKAHHLLPMGETFVEDLMTHKNLLTQLEKDENGNVSMDETFSNYQYNSYGLVKEFRTLNTGFPVVVRFFYKAL